MTYKNILKKLGQDAKKRIAKPTKSAPPSTPEEPLDFAALMHDVQPLNTEQRYRAPKPAIALIKRTQENHDIEDKQTFYIGLDYDYADIPDSFCKNGRGHQDIKRLQTGHWRVAADVDLHGYTQEQAQNILNEFIEFLQKRGVCGEIVHGSGLGSRGYTPKLKFLVRRWLMQHPDVLAYTPTSAQNDGAVRILIKRRFRPDPWAE